MATVEDFDELIAHYHRALGEFLKGNADPVMQLWSHRDDVTVANPFGPIVRGWEQVSAAIRRAAAQLSDGELVGVEIMAKYVLPDLGYIVVVERSQAKVGGSADPAPIGLRATMILRPEDDGWKVVHRHADPITTAQPAASLLQK